MDAKQGDTALDEAPPVPGTEDKTSSVGDLGKGSHEETQSGDGKAPKDLPGDKSPPAGQP